MHSVLRRSISSCLRVPSIIVERNAIQHSPSNLADAFCIIFARTSFIRVANRVNRNKEREQEVHVRKELPPRMKGETLCLDDEEPLASQLLLLPSFSGSLITRLPRNPSKINLGQTRRARESSSTGFTWPPHFFHRECIYSSALGLDSIYIDVVNPADLRVDTIDILFFFF